MRFKPVTAEDFVTYKPYFSQQRYRLCDYALASIIAWQNDHYHPLVAVHGEHLVVAAEYAHDTHQRHLMLPISRNGQMPPERLADLASDSGFDHIWFVPRCYLDAYGEAAVSVYFEIHRDAALDDYIYRRRDLAELSGAKYAKKRNLIRQFTRAHVDAGRVMVAPITGSDVDACIDYLDRWCSERECDPELEEDLACERDAAINTLQNLESLEVKGLHLRIGGEVRAFGMAAHLTPDMATLQYEKADAGVKGLYQYFDQQCARRLFNGYTYINKESDMGLPGLAKSKRSYYPVEMVAAYRLTLRS